MPDRPDREAVVREADALRVAVANRPDKPNMIDVEDVAAPYADWPADRYRALFLRDYDGPDWRITMTWASGREATMHSGGTAADGVGYLDYLREADRV